jgi:hypothetical protein
LKFEKTPTIHGRKVSSCFQGNKNKKQEFLCMFPLSLLETFLNEEMGVASFKKCDSKTNHTTV